MLQSDTESVTEEEAAPDEDSTEPDAVEDDDNLDNDTVWDPDHATPWKPHRRSRRNTSQLTSLRTHTILQPENVAQVTKYISSPQNVLLLSLSPSKKGITHLPGNRAALFSYNCTVVMHTEARAYRHKSGLPRFCKDDSL